MQKTCKHCQASFEINDDDIAFLEKLSPVVHGKKEVIPPPTLCPQCRQQRRCAQGNQLHLYKRKCDFTGEPIVSNYRSDAPYKVYKQEVWWSDQWDATSYGRAFDFGRPFLRRCIFHHCSTVTLQGGASSTTAALCR